MAGVLSANQPETKTARRKRVKAERLAKQAAAAVGAAVGGGDIFAGRQPRDVNRALATCVSEYWVREQLAGRPTPAKVIDREITLLRLAGRRLPRGSVERLAIGRQVYLLREVMPACRCVSCTKLKPDGSGNAARERRWPAHYIGSTRRRGDRESPVLWSFECYVERSELVDSVNGELLVVDPATHWSTSDTTAMHMERARRMIVDGHRVRPPDARSDLVDEGRAALLAEIRTGSGLRRDAADAPVIEPSDDED